MVIKYSDFLAAAIDERKMFTKEKVTFFVILIISSGHYLSTLMQMMLVSLQKMILKKLLRDMEEPYLTIK